MSGKPLFIAVLLALPILVSACADQEKKPSQDVLIAQKAVRQMERLNQAYAARDMSALDFLSSDEAYESIKKNMKEFRSVKLEFDYRWMNIRADGNLDARVAWKGEWSMPGMDGKVRDSGTAYFVLGAGNLELRELSGTSPFAGPSEAAMP